MYLFWTSDTRRQTPEAAPRWTLKALPRREVEREKRRRQAKINVVL